MKLLRLIIILFALPAVAQTGGAVKVWDGTRISTVRDTGSSDSLNVAIVDGSGNQVTSFGGGTQYAEGATAATATGTMCLFKDDSNVVQTIRPNNPLPVDATGSEVNLASATLASTFKVDIQSDNAGLALDSTLSSVKTSVQLIDDAVATTGSAITTKGLAASGTDGTNARVLKTDTSGELQVDVLTLPSVSGTVTCNAGTNLNTSALATAAKQPALGTAGTASTDVITVQGIASMTPLTVSDGSGAMNVIVDSGTLTAVTAITNALPAGNNNIGDMDVASIAAGNNNIGDVDIASEVPGTGATNLGKAEDAAASGGDTGVAAYGIRNDALTSNVGADGDYGPPVIDKANRLVNLPYAAPEAKVRGCASATGTSDTSVVAASGNAGLKTYIVACQIANTGSTTALITLKDGNAGATLGTSIAPTLGGANLIFPVELVTTANTALYFAAGSSSTTVYVCCQGYKAP